jgi:hypothetical protein
MSNDKQLLEQALEFFETMQRYKGVRSNIFIKFEPTATGDYLNLQEFDERAKPLVNAIQARLGEPEQEPVEWLTGCPECGMDSGCDCDSGTWNPPSGSVEEPVATTAADHIKGEIGFCQFHADVPNGSKLYTHPAPAAPVQEDRDWSLLEATQESLREHMAEIQRLKAQRQWAVPAYMKVSTASSYEFANGWNACVATIEAKFKERPGDKGA